MAERRLRQIAERGDLLRSEVIDEMAPHGRHMERRGFLNGPQPARGQRDHRVMRCDVVVNLKQWAAREGVHHVTAYRWFREGKLPVPARRVGRLILVDTNAAEAGPAGITVVYARVSSADERCDLDRQVARVTEWATSRGLTVGRVVTEIGSALNGRRTRFLALLRDPGVGTIVVEHRDRFARFGAEYVEAALSAQGRRLLVVDPAEVDDDLVRDVTEILTSLCARLYGRSAAANRAKRAAESLEQADS